MISVKSDLYKLGTLFKDIPNVALKKAAVFSMNRAAVSVRKEGAILLKRRYNLPMTGDSSGGGGRKPPGLRNMILIDKAKYVRSAPLGSFASKVRTQNKHISLVHFAVGAKTPMKQKGIPVSKRKKLKVRISPGKTITLSKSFIQKANNSTQVFRRRGTKMVKQSVPSIHVLFDKPEVRKQMNDLAMNRYRTEMARNIPFYISKIKPKSGKPR